MRVLIDTDVILELFLNRSLFVEDAEKLLEETAQSKHVDFYIVDKCLRRVRSEVGDADSALGEQSAAYIKQMFNGRIITINFTIKEKARKLPLRDFDSAEELVCATKMQLDAIITQNPQNFDRAIFPIWSVSEFLYRQKIINNLNQKNLAFDNLYLPNEQEIVDFYNLPNNSFIEILRLEIQPHVKESPTNIQEIANRIAREVEHICDKSSRIQTSGEITSWLLALARHRIQKCLHYYQLGCRRGRVELHSILGSMVYRHISAPNVQLGFDARYNLIEDFLQAFYIEAIKAFRRENELADNYSPRRKLQLAEYMAFTEQYAKRRINLPGGCNQQLIILRAQGFSRRQPQETLVDFEALEGSSTEESEAHQRSSTVQQLHTQSVLQGNFDIAEDSERNRVIQELISYLEAQGQKDCIDYLTLKLQGLSAPEIDNILAHIPHFKMSHQILHKYLMKKVNNITYNN